MPIQFWPKSIGGPADGILFTPDGRITFHENCCCDGDVGVSCTVPRECVKDGFNLAEEVEVVIPDDGWTDDTCTGCSNISGTYTLSFINDDITVFPVNPPYNQFGCDAVPGDSGDNVAWGLDVGSSICDNGWDTSHHVLFIVDCNTFPTTNVCRAFVQFTMLKDTGGGTGFCKLWRWSWEGRVINKREWKLGYSTQVCRDQIGASPDPPCPVCADPPEQVTATLLV